MRELFFDFGLGAAGDMFTAALLDLFPDREKMVEELNALGIPGVHYHAEAVNREELTGLHMKVTIGGLTEEEVNRYQNEEGVHSHGADGYQNEEGGHSYGADGHQNEEGVHCHGTDGHQHEESPHSHETDMHHHGDAAHVSYRKVREIVKGLALPQKVKEDVLEVYRIITEAEAAAHGTLVEDIHFHEVGTMDAIADITAAAYLMDRIHPDTVSATPVHAGAGTVRCAHGVLPVPAPATARILEGIPYYEGKVETELFTPTGAALLRYFVGNFRTEDVPEGGIRGRGFGSKVLPPSAGINCLTAVLFL